jgi:N-acetylneuraminate synthase
LENLGAPAYKIASPELIDLPLIRRVASTGKPIIISTGMGSAEEIGEAIAAARIGGTNQIIVLHCTAAYPTPASEANLTTINEIERLFDVIVGLSDHSMGNLIPTIAVGLGASFIEKHFTLDRSEGGVDSAFSMEPSELRDLVKSVNTAKSALGSPAFEPTASEASVLKNRRSLYAVAPIAKGEAFTSKNVRSIRPGNGMRPKYYNNILGQRAARNISFGEPLDPSMIHRYKNE